MRAVPVTVIGDRFMLVSAFVDALERIANGRIPFAIRTHELAWPDEPMIIEDARVPGVSEFVGDPQRIAELLDGTRVLVNHLAPVTDGMLAGLPSLKLIAVARGGPVNIDCAAAKRRGISVVTAPGRNDTAVAEFTVGAIITETRRIRAGHEALRAGRWRGDLYRAQLTGDELCDMTVGTIGYGRVGRIFVRMMKVFGCRLLAYDPYAQSDGAAEQTGLEELLRCSDVVVLNARVTAETKKMMNRERLALMKRGALFVNPARGPLVDYDALYEELASGRLGGAVLDTFEPEPPPPDWPLLSLPNVTVTPHIAGASKRTIARAAEIVAEKVVSYIDSADGGSLAAINRSRQTGDTK